MEMMNGLFGIMGLACGIYCIYAFITMKKTGEINTTILLPKDANPRQCKDKEAYLNCLMPKVLVLGIVTSAYGLLDLYEGYVGSTGVFYLIMLGAFFLVLVWFVAALSKANKKYF